MSKKKKDWKNPIENKNFCIVPWVHTYLSPQTERRMCCASRENSSFVQQYIDRPGENGKQYKPASLKEHWNSEHMRSVRLRMLSGEILPECEVCNNNTLSLSTYRHWFTKELFANVIEDSVNKTSEDGTFEELPISFDYRFDNTCNFKCRTCGDQFSSAWEAENRYSGDYSFSSESWILPENRKAIAAFQKTQIEVEFAEAVESKKIREIYWVGGEPLMWQQHWKYMQRIVELGYADKVFVRYNTNLSKIESNGTHLFRDILKHFKNYMISASIDGEGKIGEFIRTGLVWSNWIRNFEEGVKYSQKRSDTSMLFDVTISLPTLFSIEKLLDHALSLNVRMEVKVMYGFDPFVVLHPLALPKKVLHSLLDDIIKKIENKVTEKQLPLLNTLLDLKNRPTYEELFPESYKKEFYKGREYLKKIGKRRNDGTDGLLSFEEIYSTQPEVLAWWNQ